MNKLIRKLKSAGNTIISDRHLFMGVIGLSILLFAVVFAPVITSFDPRHFGPNSLNPLMTNGHILGTNHMGQDVFAMIIYGARTSLMVAVISGLISGGLGIIVGGIAGFFGGVVDRVLSEIINVFMMIPTLFLIILIVAIYGGGLANIMIVIGLTTWPANAKLMRAQAMSIRQRTFVKSAVAMGENNSQLLFKYIIPNGLFPVVANTTLGMANAVLSEASLSFLGLGDPTAISWGQMVQQGRMFLTTAWWTTTFGGIAIIFTIVVFNLLGDGLNHVINPKHTSRGDK
ncbi:MAG: ABC transporter permease [Treponema sp.]|nr:ABC transporter permease [Treponema sp.]